MARIFTDGAEMRDGIFWDRLSYGYPTVGDTFPAFSPYYYVMASGGSTNFSSTGRYIPAMSECYYRVRIRAAAYTGLRLVTFFTNVTEVAWLGVDAGYHFTAYATTIGELQASDVVINLNQWYLVEVYFKMADAPDGRFVVKVDGNQIIDYTGDTKPDTGTTFDNVGNGRYGTSALYCDDLALNDTTGGSDNSWCGDGIIVKVTPNGDGAHNNWHGSDADDVNNYLLVDEYPKDDNTTYVYHDGSSSGTQDQYGLTDDYVGTNKTILRIYPEARMRKTSAQAHTGKLGILPSGGVDQMSAERTLLIGDYIRVVGDEYTVNPVDSEAWEEADIDALEFVVEVG